MTRAGWMGLIVVAIVGALAYGYLTWPSPGGNQSPPPVARFDDEGTPRVAYRDGRRWDLLPLPEAHDRAQQAVGFTFKLPDLPPELLFPAQVSVLAGGMADPASEPGTYSVIIITYVLHPRIDDDGRVRLPGGGSVPAPDHRNVGISLSIEYPITDLPIPAGAVEISTNATPRIVVTPEFIGSQPGAVDASYTWLIGDARYTLINAPALRWYPREEMLAIVDATAR